MNGLHLSVEARRLRPRLKVLLTSGYDGSTFTPNRSPQDQFPVLKKPYFQHELAGKLRLVISSNE
jgi:hypothetical protein